MNKSNRNPVKVGIWGLGRAGFHMHCSELDQYPELFQITAVCDELPERCSELEKRYPGVHSFTDGEAFLKDPSFELCSIVVRSQCHVDYAVKALSAGKTVFLEKPVALTDDGADILEAAAKLFPGKLFFRQNRRFEAAFNHIREIMQAGILGDIYEIKLRRHRYQARRDWQTLVRCGGGQINNWGPHLIDHSLRLLESPVKDLWSDFKTVAARGDAEDHIKVIFRGENGRIVDLEISDGVQIPSNVYEIYGTRGTLVSKDETTLHMRYLDPAFAIPPDESTPETLPRDEGYGDAGSWPWLETTVPTHPANGYEMTAIYQYLYAALREGKPFPVKTEEALQVVRVTNELKRQNPRYPLASDKFDFEE